jgi:hypothetical protein
MVTLFMNRTILTAILILAPVVLCGADTQWVLEKSTLAYHVDHPLHTTEGVSHAARGKGVCHAGGCDFLIAAPVKSFDSGDSNRDLHMIQVVRGGQYPIITVRTRVPESDATAAMFKADLEIQFAGQTVQFKQVEFRRETQGNSIKLTGTISAKASEFKIDPPKFLTVPIKNEIPIRVDMTWQPQ